MLFLPHTCKTPHESADRISTKAYHVLRVSLSPMSERTISNTRVRNPTARQNLSSVSSIAQNNSAEATAEDASRAQESEQILSAQTVFMAWFDSEIKRRLVYPKRAQQRHIEGIVKLLVTINADGTQCNSRVTNSSGSALLDQAALDLVSSLFPSPVSPKKELTESINIQYIFVQD